MCRYISDRRAFRFVTAQAATSLDITAAFCAPLASLRADLGALLTAGPYLKAMADPRIGLKASLLSGPWSAVLDAAGVTDKWLRHWFDFLAFAFSGLPSDGTVAAAMVYMLADLHRDGARMDYPRGGSGAVVDALVRGLTKHGGELRLRSAVAEVLVAEGADGELGRCTGVRLAGGQVVHARRAVVSNAPVSLVFLKAFLVAFALSSAVLVS